MAEYGARNANTKKDSLKYAVLKKQLCVENIASF